MLRPKYFYSYAKKFAKTKHSITQLITDENVVLTDRKDIADALQEQYCSSFSDPHNPDKKVPTSRIPSKSFSDITFSVDDTIKAIDEISANSIFRS